MPVTDVQWWREFVEHLAGRLNDSQAQLAVESPQGAEVAATVQWTGEVDPETRGLGAFVVARLSTPPVPTGQPAASAETIRVKVELTPEPPFSATALAVGQPPATGSGAGAEQPRWDDLRPRFTEAVRQHVRKVANDVIAASAPPGRRAQL